MIKQIINVDYYWKVIVYYNVNYSFFNDIAKDLKSAYATKSEIRELYHTMRFGKAKAVTFSNTKLKISIVCINKPDNIYDLINSIVHEAEHIKQSMLYAYNIHDAGEPPAYTICYLVMKMYRVIRESF